MVKFSLKENGIFYSRWYYTLLLIGVVSLLIGYIFSYVMGLDFFPMSVFLRSFFSTAAIWGGCMSIVVFCWKRFPWEQMPLKHLVLEVLLILLFLSVFIGLEFLVWFLTKEKACPKAFEHGAEQIAITFLITFLITSIHEAVFFYRQWKLNFSKSVSLEKDNIEARYNALKAQINPHFLFNSLNSLMTLVENNPQAEEYIQELSEFLRYVLISNERGLVTLAEEAEYLDKYIYLQKIRFGINLQVVRTIPESLFDLRIPPLVLQMLFDNCIKHNVITAQHPLQVSVVAHDNYVSVTNNLQPKHVPESTGRGLGNIEGRYRLFTPHPVKIQRTEQTFSVSVPLINDDKQ